MYNVKEIKVYQEPFYICSALNKFYHGEHDNLTPREQEVFYGIEAKKFLGLPLEKRKTRSRTKSTLE